MTNRPEPLSPSETSSQLQPTSSRRGFLKGSTVAGAAVLSGDLLVPMVHAAGSGTIKVGLVGCGGRGTGAASRRSRPIAARA